MIARRVICPLRRQDMATHHPLYYKGESEYWASYTGPVRRALAAVGGLSVEPPGEPLHYFVLTWHLDEGIARMGVCYSDYPDLTIWADVPDIDGIMKMKHHPERTQGQVEVPVFPGGFCLAVGAGTGDTGAYLAKLPELREQRDHADKRGLYYNQGFFREFAVPLHNRQIFRAYFTGHRGRWTDQGTFLDNLLSHRCMLNVCGHGNSIDRKVVEACAIGIPMISDRGLETLALPWGMSFRHGENIWFVDTPEEAAEAAAGLSDEELERITSGARRLFDRCFAPRPMGEWYLEKARDVARPR